MVSGYNTEQAESYSNQINSYRKQDPGAILLHELVIGEHRHATETQGYYLDIGCGKGDDIAYLNSHGVTPLVGVEPSHFYRPDETLNILTGSAENIPLPNESVIVAFSRHALHYCPNLSLAFREISRALKPNSSLYAIVSHPDADELCDKAEERKIIASLFNGAVKVSIYPYQKDDYKNAANDHDMTFEVIKEYWAPGRDETPDDTVFNAYLFKSTKRNL